MCLFVYSYLHVLFNCSQLHFVPYLIYCFMHDYLVLHICITHLYHIDSCICIYTLPILWSTLLLLSVFCFCVCFGSFALFFWTFVFIIKIIKIFIITNEWKRENLAVASFFPELSWWPDSWLVTQAALILERILK